MSVYKRITILTGIIAVVTFSVTLILHYNLSCNEIDFWINILLGIFGGAILSTLTSIVSYYYERRKTLEGFVYHTRQILSFLNKYQENVSIEDKIKFYLDYYDMDKSAWDMDFGNMDFFFERIHHNRKYIYSSVYKPIFDFNAAVSNHVWHFRWHLDGSGRNEKVIQSFLDELQERLLKKSEKAIKADEEGNIVKCSYTKNQLVENIEKELSERYYDIMNGKSR